MGHVATTKPLQTATHCTHYCRCGCNRGLDTEVPSEIVSAFDLDVIYDSAVISATGVSFGALLGDLVSFEAQTRANTSVSGIVDFAEISFLSDTELGSLQPGDFTLATLSFRAIDLGTSSLSFDLDPQFGTNVVGLNTTTLTLDSIGNARISIVPVPGTMLLLASGLLIIVRLGVGKESLAPAIKRRGKP